MRSFLNSVFSLVALAVIALLLVKGDVEMTVNFKDFNYTLNLQLDQIAISLFLGLGLIQSLSGLRDAVIISKVHTADGTKTYRFIADPGEDLRVQGQAFSGQRGLKDRENWVLPDGRVAKLMGSLDTEFFNIFMLRKESRLELWAGIPKPEKKKSAVSVVKMLSRCVQVIIIAAVFIVPEQYREYLDIVLVAANLIGLIQCIRPALVKYSVQHIDSGEIFATDTSFEPAYKPVRAKYMGRAGQKGKRDGAVYADPESGWMIGLAQTDVHKEFDWITLRTVNTIVFHVRPEVAKVEDKADKKDNKKTTSKKKKK